jgi:hypothetical protein
MKTTKSIFRVLKITFGLKGRICTSSLVPLLTVILVFTSTAAMAQSFGDWQYSINGNNVIITRYTGTNADVSIPSTINGLPVQYIRGTAFYGNTSVTSVFVPSSITGVDGGQANPFDFCINLVSITVDPLNWVFSSVEGVLFNKNQTTVLGYPMGKLGSYAIPVGVALVASYAFDTCSNLTGLTIPSTVTHIMSYGFVGCSGLSSVTIPASVATLGDHAFCDCYGLTNIFFMGNAPAAGWFAFGVDWPSPPKIIYYLPGTTGWSSTFDGVPTAPWVPTVSTPSVQSDQFGFNITWGNGMTIIVEASMSLSGGTWVPLATNSLSSGSFYFSDPQWASCPARFYRLRSP